MVSSLYRSVYKYDNKLSQMCDDESFHKPVVKSGEIVSTVEYIYIYMTGIFERK